MKRTYYEGPHYAFSPLPWVQILSSAPVYKMFDSVGCLMHNVLYMSSKENHSIECLPVCKFVRITAILGNNT